MKISTPTIVIGSIVIAIAAIGAVFFFSPKSTKGDELIPFAECLKDNGALFYGAFWCPHCQAQKALFGNAAKHLPYVECSTPDASGQLPVCDEKGVTNYPTWFFKDGTKKVGEMTLAELAEKTSCQLSSGAATSTAVTSASSSSSAAPQTPVIATTTASTTVGI